MAGQEEKKINIQKIKKKWLQSRNFWTFFVSGSAATVVSFWMILKCSTPEGFDHDKANLHYSTWGNTIALFWGVFVMQNTLKYLFTRPASPSSAGDTID